MAGVSEPNEVQATQANQPNPVPAPEQAAPSPPAGSAAPPASSPPAAGVSGELSEVIRAIQERQDRDYNRYVKAYRDYHEHAETYRDWVVGGVRIRARETACSRCMDAGTKIYDADSLPKLPLAGCAGDGDGYCSCTYVVALRRASAAALAPEAATPPPPPSSAPSIVPGVCPSCGAVMASGATVCRVCGTPNPAVLAMSLSPERPGAPRAGVADLPPGRNRWLRTLLGGRRSPEDSGAQPVPEGVPAAPGAEAASGLDLSAPGVAVRRRKPLPMLQPLQRASYRLTRRWHRRTVTLSADMGTIRVVVFRGRDVIAWGAARPDEDPDVPEQEASTPEQRSLPVLLDLLDELRVRRERPSKGITAQATRLKKVLEPFGFRRTRVVTDLPLYDTLVRHLQLPRVAQNYLEPMVVSEVLESIPFARSEVDIAWHMRRRGSSQSVFAVATPKDRLDRHVGLLKTAGIPPAASYSRAEAMAFAAGISDGILVHLEAAQASVVLVQGSLPRVVHQVDLSNGEDSVQVRSDLLARTVDQVSGYYHTLGIADDSGAWPVVLTGQFTEPLAAALQQLSHRRAVSFGPELNWPEGFRPEDYAANLGLFLAYEARSRDRSRVVRRPWVPLNLLAERHLPRMVPVTPVAVFVTLLLLWLHPFDLVGQVNARVVNTQSLSAQVETLKGNAQKHRASQAAEKATQGETQELNRQRQILQMQLDETATNVDTLLSRLETMTNAALPMGVSLNSLLQRGDGFTLVGTANSYDQALAYTANLRDSGYFSDARVLKVDGREDPDNPLGGSVSFQIEAVVPVVEEDAGDAE